MTVWDEDGASTVFARLMGVYRQERGDGDCPWCRSLLGPHPAPAEAARAGSGDRSPPREGVPRVWAGRLRRLMVPVAAVTVVAALLLTLA